jgi:Zn-finger nucleic acid-binding protein
MKCPACFNELTEFQVGNFTVDVCQGGCGGIWFDAFELQKVDEERETAGEPLLHIQRDERLIVDQSRKRECPRCAGVKLHRHFFSAKRRVEVDQCPNCAGYWLDAGELALIRAEKSQAAIADHAGQSSVSTEVIRYLYRLRTEQRRP